MCVLDLYSQEKEIALSNFYYFSTGDSIFYTPESLKERKIKGVSEFLLDDNYGDSLILIAEYQFAPSGFLTKVHSCDVHGRCSDELFNLNENGNVLNIIYKGEKILENEFNGAKLTKQSAIYSPYYVVTKERRYNEQGLLTSIKHAGPYSRWLLDTFNYDTSNRLINKKTLRNGDTLVEEITYTYNTSGKVVSVQNRSPGYNSIQYFFDPPVNNMLYKIISSGETSDHTDSIILLKITNGTIEKEFAGKKLQKTITRLYNDRNQLVLEETDRRMSVKRRRKPNIFCGYGGPARYEKTENSYDDNGNLISVKHSFEKKDVYQTNFEYDTKGSLLRKIIFENGVKDKEWLYTYVVY